jgi:hypothetical protein
MASVTLGNLVHRRTETYVQMAAMAPTQLATTMMAISVPWLRPLLLPLVSCDELAEGAVEGELVTAVEVTLTLMTPGVEDAAWVVEWSVDADGGADEDAGRLWLDEGIAVIPATTELTSILGACVLGVVAGTLRAGLTAGADVPGANRDKSWRSARPWWRSL